MERPGRNHDGISVPSRALSLFVEDEFGLSLFDTEELVDVGMHLVANFFPRSQAHHHNLDVFSGV
jgi:hypothetical protein